MTKLTSTELAVQMREFTEAGIVARVLIQPNDKQPLTPETKCRIAFESALGLN